MLQLLYVTVPAIEEAQSIAKKLITSRLIACCNIIPNVLGLYMWEDKLNQSNECLLILKTSKQMVTQVKENILSIHSYELSLYFIYRYQY